MLKKIFNLWYPGVGNKNSYIDKQDDVVHGICLPQRLRKSLCPYPLLTVWRVLYPNIEECVLVGMLSDVGWEIGCGTGLLLGISRHHWCWHVTGDLGMNSSCQCWCAVWGSPAAAGVGVQLGNSGWSPVLACCWKWPSGRQYWGATEGCLVAASISALSEVAQ